MSLRDFAIMILVCLAWGFNTVISKMVVGEWGAPPLFYAAARFGLVTLMVLPWLLPAPRPVWRIVLVGLTMGGGTFALMFLGLKTATPSEAAIVSQLGVPATTVLSMIFLGEKIHWRRGVGIALSLAGVLIVMWDPAGFHASRGMLLIAVGALSGSVGAIMMKRMEGVKPLQFQAWVGLSSLWPLVVLTLMLEPGGTQAGLSLGWPFFGALLFSALVSSVIAHTAYFGLIQRYEANLVAPLTLMAPLFTILLGVVLTNDPFGWKMAAGSAVALGGVLIIALRRNHVAPLILLLRNRT